MTLHKIKMESHRHVYFYSRILEEKKIYLGRNQMILARKHISCYV
jgi:hypothetical protein